MKHANVFVVICLSLGLLAPASAQPSEKPALTYGTYLGGTKSDHSPQTRFTAVERDQQGNILAAGSARAGGIATPGAAQDEPAGGTDPLLAKYSPTGDLLWATYWGGDEADYGMDLAVDAAGNAYITGWTFAGFPTTPGAEAGTCDVEDQSSFVAKFSPTGQLLWSTCVDTERTYNIGLSSSGTVLVSGDTTPQDLPGATSIGPGGGFDVFIAEIAGDGSRLLRSVLIGGDGVQGTFAMHVDDVGAVYLTGGTTAEDWPTTPGAPDDSKQGSSDAFLVKVAPDLDALEYSTYIGAAGVQDGYALDVDGQGQACAAGDESGGVLGNRDRQWVECLNREGTERTFSYGYHPEGDIHTEALIFLPNGRLLLAGATDAPDLFLTNEIQSKKGGDFDGWVADLTFDGDSFFSTYLGGKGSDGLAALHVDANGTIAVAGSTASGDMPLIDPAQRKPRGKTDGYLGVISPTDTGCTMLGTDGPNRMWGTIRKDRMCGLGGDDILRARDLNDLLRGGPGDDRLLGGPGKDTARGGRGNDSCTAERTYSC